MKPKPKDVIKNTIKLILLYFFLTKPAVLLSFYEDITMLKGSARSLGTSAALASDDQIAGVVVNPSNISTNKNIISLSYSSLHTIGVSNIYLTYIKPLSNTKLYKKTNIESFGISVFYNSCDFTNTSQLDFYDLNQNNVKDENEEILYEKSKLTRETATNLAVFLALLRKVSNINIGLSLKYLAYKISNENAYFSSIDISAKTKLLENLMFAIKTDNLISTPVIWSTGSKEKKEKSLELGLNYTYKLSTNFLISAGADYSISKTNNTSFGIEAKYNEKYSARVGFTTYRYTENSIDSLSCGIGIMLKEGISLDYSLKFLQYIQENLHFLSLSYSF